MHVDPTINLGQIITFVLTCGGLLIGLGRIAQSLTNNTRELAQLRADFHEHVQQDNDNFKMVNETILKLVSGGKL